MGGGGLYLHPAGRLERGLACGVPLGSCVPIVREALAVYVPGVLPVPSNGVLLGVTEDGEQAGCYEPGTKEKLHVQQNPTTWAFISHHPTWERAWGVGARQPIYPTGGGPEGYKRMDHAERGHWMTGTAGGRSESMSERSLF